MNKITTVVITALSQSLLTNYILMKLQINESHYTYKLHSESFIWRVITWVLLRGVGRLSKTSKDLKKAVLLFRSNKLGRIFSPGESFQFQYQISYILFGYKVHHQFINYQEKKSKIGNLIRYSGIKLGSLGFLRHNLQFLTLVLGGEKKEKSPLRF